MDLNGKNIILTGAASGIGLQIMKLLVQHPVRMLAVDRNKSALLEACHEINSSMVERNPGVHTSVQPLVSDLSSTRNVDLCSRKPCPGWGKSIFSSQTPDFPTTR